MRSKALGILVVLAALPLWAQVSGDAVSKGMLSTTTIDVNGTARVHAPRRAVGPAPGRARGDSIWESNNWAGYAVTGSGFTQARGSWVVPAVDCAVTRNASVSFWVGMDGWNDATVEQTGTDSDCDGDRPKYYAWYEFFPKAGVSITSVAVSPGDAMAAEVDYDGSEFTITMTNQSTGESYSTSAAVPGARRESAEWITEMNGSVLSDFGTARFGSDFTGAMNSNSATDAATSGPIGTFKKGVQASIMVAGKDVDEAVPSFLSLDGTSFTVSWWSK
jgi:Peptidase A4 family